MTAPGISPKPPCRTIPISSYGYDNAHRPTSITNALGESQGITYDSAGQRDADPLEERQQRDQAPAHGDL